MQVALGWQGEPRHSLMSAGVVVLRVGQTRANFAYQCMTYCQSQGGSQAYRDTCDLAQGSHTAESSCHWKHYIRCSLYKEKNNV